MGLGLGEQGYRLSPALVRRARVEVPGVSANTGFLLCQHEHVRFLDRCIRTAVSCLFAPLDLRAATLTEFNRKFGDVFEGTRFLGAVPTAPLPGRLCRGEGRCDESGEAGGCLPQGRRRGSGMGVGNVEGRLSFPRHGQVRMREDGRGWCRA